MRSHETVASRSLSETPAWRLHFDRREEGEISILHCRAMGTTVLHRLVAMDQAGNFHDLGIPGVPSAIDCRLIKISCAPRRAELGDGCRDASVSARGV